jgi:hypothetical protein
MSCQRMQAGSNRWIRERQTETSQTRKERRKNNSITEYVLCLGNTDAVELGRVGEHASAKPHGKALHVVRHNVHVNLPGFDTVLDEMRVTRQVTGETSVHPLLDITLQAAAKILEHGGATGQHDVVVKCAAAIDRRLENGLVHHLWERCDEVTAEDFRVEEHFWAEKPFVAHVAAVWEFRLPLDAFVSVCVRGGGSE